MNLRLRDELSKAKSRKQNTYTKVYLDALIKYIKFYCGLCQSVQRTLELDSIIPEFIKNSKTDLSSLT